jgi:hypothetical protein
MRTTAEIYKDLAECMQRQADLYCELAKASATTIEVVEKPPQDVNQVPSAQQPLYKLGRFLKGKYALIIWAGCKLGAFVRTDGKDVNMREVANHIGASLGLHFTEQEWKSTLEGNFNVNEPRKFLWRMENEVWQRYLGPKKA